AAGDKVNELHLGDGAKTKVAHAAGCPDDGAFADGRVDDPLPPKAFEQAFTDLEGTAVNAYVFAKEYDRWIAFHFFKERLLDGLEKCYRRHGYLLLPSGRAVDREPPPLVLDANVTFVGFLPLVFTAACAFTLNASFIAVSVFGRRSTAGCLAAG